MKKYLELMKYLAILVIVYIVSLTSYVGNVLMIGVMIGLLVSGMNFIIVIAIGTLLIFTKVIEIGINGAMILSSVLIFLTVIYRFSNGSMMRVEKIIIPLILGVVYSIIMALTPIFIINQSIITVLSTLICIYAIDYLKIITSGENPSKFEKMSFFVMLFVFGSGVTRLSIFMGNGYFLVVPFLILLSYGIKKDYFACILAVVMGLAGYYETQLVGYLLMPVFTLFVAIAFLDVSLIGTLIIAILVEVFNVMILDSYTGVSITNMVLYAISVLAFVFVPKQILIEANKKINLESIEIGRGFVNQGRNQSSKKIMEVSDIFKQLERVFSGLIKGKMNSEFAIELIKSEVRNGVCEKCNGKSKCVSSRNSQMIEEIESLILSAFAHGSVNLLNISEFMSKNCVNANQVLASINKNVSDMMNYNNNMKGADSCKLVLSKQFKGISKTLEKLAFEMGRDISFDRELENEITESLKNINIKFDNVFCYFEEDNLPTVLVTLKSKERKGKTIAKVISKVCGMKMIAGNAEKGNNKGQILVNYHPSARYDVSFGVAFSKKQDSTACGDSHTLTRLGNHSFMISLSDGMGSGEQARDVSERAITLVESLYKAGFSDDIVTTTVNNMLTLTNFETFTAIDICVLNLVDLECNFIKIGSPPSYLIGADIKTIEGDSLPLGILEEITPTKRKLMLKEGDFIVFITDGVYDLLGNQVANIIRKNKYATPQTLADSIIETAKHTGEGANYDDMSVIVAKIFEL